MLSRELLEYPQEAVLDALEDGDPWEYAESLVSRGYLPPAALSGMLELKKGTQLTQGHLRVIDAMLEGFGVIKYRIKEQEKRFLAMRKKVQTYLKGEKDV